VGHFQRPVLHGRRLLLLAAEPILQEFALR
jgi:hypothetical protein